MSAAEFIVSVAASIGFLYGLGSSNIPLRIVAALLVGGVIAAPIAAWLVSRLATRWLGVGVGLVLILTNARTLLKGIGVADGQRYAAYAVLVVLWAGVVAYGVRIAGRQAVVEEERELETAGSR